MSVEITKTLRLAQPCCSQLDVFAVNVRAGGELRLELLEIAQRPFARQKL